MLLAPEHTLVDRFANESPDPQAFRDRVGKFRALDRQARRDGSVEKEGFDTGRTALNPFTGKEVPIWVANFVLAEYGTGAIMAVPAHDERDFEFARKYRLPIRIVVRSPETPATADELTAPTTHYGRVVDSGPWDGQEAPAVISNMIADAEKRGLPELKPLLDDLALATGELRAANLTPEAVGAPPAHRPDSTATENVGPVAPPRAAGGMMTIEEFGRKLRAHEVSAADMTDECLKRIDGDSTRSSS